MSNNEKGEMVTENSEENKVLERLNSHKRKIDEMAGKLQSIEKSISKIPKLDEKSKLAKKFVLKHVFRNVANLKEDESSFSPTVKHFNMKWRTQIKRLGDYVEVYVICDPIDSSTDEWSIETKLEFKMIGHDGYSMTKSVKNRFETENEWVSLDFMEWTRYLTHNGQTILMTVEVNVEIVKITGVSGKRFGIRSVFIRN